MSSLDSVFASFVDDYLKLCELLRSFDLPRRDLFEGFRSMVEGSRRILCVGTGRSGDVADILSKFLRNVGFHSYGPDELPYMLSRGDLVVAVSGSGLTPYTLEIAKIAKGVGVPIVGFTSNMDSPLAQLLDLTFHIPGAPRRRPLRYEVVSLSGIYSTPLLMLGGTLFELRSLLTVLSFIGYMVLGLDPYKIFADMVSSCMSFNPDPNQVKSLYMLIPKPRSVGNPLSGKVVAVGEGLSGIVARFFITRLRHCAHPDEERVCFYWRDRGSVALKSGDLTLIVSGSGEGVPATMARIAKMKDSKVASITSYLDSELARLSDIVIYVPGRILQRVEGLRGSYLPTDPRHSIFELRTILLLETFVQSIARIEGLTDKDLWAHHPDFI